MFGTNFVKVHFSIANFSVCTKENSSFLSLNLDHISPSMVKGSRSLMVGYGCQWITLCEDLAHLIPMRIVSICQEMSTLDKKKKMMCIVLFRKFGLD